MRGSLGERISGNEEQTGNPVKEALEWELEEDGKAGEVEATSEGESVEGGYGATGDRAETGPSNLRVEVAVPEVIHGATGTTHDECAAEEEKGGAEDGEGG